MPEALTDLIPFPNIALHFPSNVVSAWGFGGDAGEDLVGLVVHGLKITTLVGGVGSELVYSSLSYSCIS